MIIYPLDIGVLSDKVYKLDVIILNRIDELII